MILQEAADRLLAGELVVFPTETVYGLGALASHDDAVRRIFEVKGRPAQNPLILHIAENCQLDELVESVPESAKKLIKHFWPGPLTICLKKSKKVSDLVSAGLPTVCVRRPNHPIAQDLLKLVGEPIAAPSANLSGKPSTTTFQDAKRQLEQKGVSFLDGGKSPLGLESTVVDCSSEPVKLLRPGVIGQAELEKVLGESIVGESSIRGEQVTSPGQLLQHYAPAGELTVLFGTAEARKKWFSEQNFDSEFRWVFGLAGVKNEILSHSYLLTERENDLETYASELYSFLNWCDEQRAEKIILELPQVNHPLLEALLNRLEKASKGKIVRLS